MANKNTPSYVPPPTGLTATSPGFPRWLQQLYSRVTNSLLGLTVSTGGDINGTFDSDSEMLSLNLSDTGVAAGTYGSATVVPQLTVDAKGRLDSVLNVAIAFPPPIVAVGPTSGRPVGAANGTWYLDTSLSPVRPIISYSPSTTGWIDCAGTDV